MKIFKILFFCVLVTNSLFSQDVTLEFAESQVTEGFSNVMGLNFRLNYIGPATNSPCDFSTFGGVVTVPAGYNISNVATASTKLQIVSVDNANHTFEFKFLNLSQTSSGSNEEVVSVSGIFTPPVQCSSVQNDLFNLSIIALPITGSTCIAAPVAGSTLQVTLQADEELRIEQDQISENNCVLPSGQNQGIVPFEGSPIKQRITISKKNFAADYNVNITLDKGTADLQVIGITEVDPVMENNVRNITNFNDNGTSVSFSVSFPPSVNASLNPNARKEQKYYIYFKATNLPTTGVESVFESKATAVFHDQNCSTSITVDDYTADPMNLTDRNLRIYPCDDQEVTKVPDLRYWNESGSCFGSVCPVVGGFFYQVDNSFSDPNKINYTGPFTFELELGSGLNVSSFDIRLIDGYSTNVSSAGTFDVQHQIVGGSWVTSGPFNYGTVISKGGQLGINTNDKIEKIRIIYSDFDQLNSSLIHFSHDFVSGSLPAHVTSGAKLVYGGQDLKSRLGNQATINSGGACSGLQLTDYFLATNDNNNLNASKEFRQNAVFTRGTKTTLLLKLDYFGLRSNLDFHYLFENAILSANNFKFYFGTDVIEGTNASSLSKFKDLQSFKQTPGFLGLGASVDANNLLTISGINLPYNACSQNLPKKLYIAIDVDFDPFAYPKVYTNSNGTYGNPVQNYDEYLPKFRGYQILADGRFNSKLSQKCGTYEKKVLELVGGDDFTYSYVVNNLGNIPAKEVIIFNQFPNPSDEFYIEQQSGIQNRASTSALECTDISNIVISLETINGLELNSNITNEFDIKVSGGNNLSVAELGVQKFGSVVTTPNWQPFTGGCTGGAFGLKIEKTSTSNFVLSGGQRLVIKLQMKSPVGGAIGDRFENNIAVAYKLDNGLFLKGSETNSRQMLIGAVSTCTNGVYTPPCTDCKTVTLKADSLYVISAWVSNGEEIPENAPSFSDASIKVTFYNSTNVATPYIFTSSGNNVNGWQRIHESFKVPAGSERMDIEFLNASGAATAAYFDDFRIHPFNASMMTYVYNPVTMQLEAQLDENNYYTKYIYDEEGNLVKVNSETIDGVRTTAETRTNIAR